MRACVRACVCVCLCACVCVCVCVCERERERESGREEAIEREIMREREREWLCHSNPLSNIHGTTEILPIGVENTKQVLLSIHSSNRRAS